MTDTQPDVYVTYVNTHDGREREILQGSAQEAFYDRSKHWRLEETLEPTEPPERQLSDLSVAELDALIDEHGLEVDKSLNKPEKVAAIEAAAQAAQG